MEEQRTIHEKPTSFPNTPDILAASHDPRKMLKLGESATNYLDSNFKHGYDMRWVEDLHRSVAALKDCLEANQPSNLAAAKLRILLENRINKALTKAELRELGEPSPTLIEAWTWGIDTARSVWFFIGSIVFVVFAIMSFAMFVYAFDLPTRPITLISTILGALFLSIAWASLGYGLYRVYVYTPYEDYDLNLPYEIGYGVSRNGAPWKDRNWYVYSVGGIFFAASLAIVLLGSVDNSS